MSTRVFGDLLDLDFVPDLADIQVKPYDDLLQKDILPSEREDTGVEAVLREVFPIECPVTGRYIEYISYSMIEPRYTPDECRALRKTYEYALKIKVRLHQEEPVEESVLLCHIPKMIGGGKFVINGIDRLIVTQINRPPGIDFEEKAYSDGSKFFSCGIVPERGSWIKFTISKKNVLYARIDNRIKVPATVLFKVLFGSHCTTSDLIRDICETRIETLSGRKSIGKIAGKIIVTPIINQETGEIYIKAGEEITESFAEDLVESGLTEIEILDPPEDKLILNTIMADETMDYNSALRLLYAKFRPGNPFNEEKAQELIESRFNDPNRYNLGPIGRFRINRKFKLEVPEDCYTLTKEDFLGLIEYLTGLRKNKQGYELDDIDHLGNRRIRTIKDQFEEVFRSGLVRLKRYIVDKLSKHQGAESDEPITPSLFFKSQAVSSAVNYFFQRGELSQIVDQTNPLSQLTHERRLSALGEGGLNRKRAGFKVRDVHISHYGRICPIETPEGGNIGLIVSLSIFASIDKLGFLTTPYFPADKVSGKKGTAVKSDDLFLRADEEEEFNIAPAEFIPLVRDGADKKTTIPVRKAGEVLNVTLADVDRFDISPKQMIGISAALIPFLEHDDANRALMGSNMMRQAVPLLNCAPPLVSTGIEGVVAKNTDMVLKADEDGEVTYADGGKIIINDDTEYYMEKFGHMNGYTCLNQRPIVRKGDMVKKGDILTDGPAIKNGQLALGRNLLVAFMSWHGYNFEDALIVSEKVVRENKLTSVNIETFRTETRETKLGKEYFTNDIPHLKADALKNLDENGLIRVGTKVEPGDILIGKIAPKSHTELSPEEKLLLAIFGRAGEDVKNVSLICKPGVEGVVTKVEKFSRTKALSEEEKEIRKQKIRQIDQDYNLRLEKYSLGLLNEYKNAKLKSIEFGISGETVDLTADFNELNRRQLRRIAKNANDIEKPKNISQDSLSRISEIEGEINELLADMKLTKAKIKRDDDLPTGVLELARVYVSRKCVLEVGDKLAGRHGNKGVISTIVPEEDMPFLSDGTSIEMVFNPLGVPSRMNVGQILETHLGWAAREIGFQAITPPFEGVEESDIFGCLEEAGLPSNGKVTLYDGLTGDAFDQQITVGCMYVMKLHHFAIDKIHARSTGSYSLVTQQPLGGKKRNGGQRFGEMEVWALEAYGVSHVLQELLTVKSDDVAGRSRIYESMVKGANILEAGIPLSFEVLRREIMGLALDFELHTR